MKRNHFIKTGAIGMAGLWTLPVFSNSSVQEIHEPVSNQIIKEFVIAGHKNLDKVKEMLLEKPNLLYARYDWGDGDFEEAIEGAGHVGNKELANYLINKGARVNLFVLTMLGKTNLVKPVLEDFPKLLHARGPHGFTLLHHAKVGGEDSNELYDYLSRKGLKETKMPF
jgi:hypothetical protein